MNPSPDIGPTPPEGDFGPMSRTKPPANWREALLGLIAARVGLIQIEAKDASRQAARRALFLATAGASAFFCWALLLAGGISWISEATGWPWNRIAVAAAAAHLLGAMIFAKGAKSPAEPAFPLTRAEFQKDREWIENFQNPSKSKN